MLKFDAVSDHGLCVMRQRRTILMPVRGINLHASDNRPTTNRPNLNTDYSMYTWHLSLSLPFNLETVGGRYGSVITEALPRQACAGC